MNVKGISLSLEAIRIVTEILRVLDKSPRPLTRREILMHPKLGCFVEEEIFYHLDFLANSKKVYSGHFATQSGQSVLIYCAKREPSTENQPQTSPL